MGGKYERCVYTRHERRVFRRKGLSDLAPAERPLMPMMYNHGQWSHFDEKTENGLHA